MNTFFIIVFWAFVFWVSIQYLYAIFLYSKAFRKASRCPATIKKPVSVIICAKNEALNLERNLPSVLEQNYLDVDGQKLYEVIVVDDESTDETLTVLRQLAKRFEHLRIIAIPNGTIHDLKGKKFALRAGVEQARNEFLLLTDADCKPASNNWLRQMVAPLNEGKQIVAGFGAYNYVPGMLNAFSRWENVHSFLQLVSYAKAGLPYMASGRNIACSRHLMQLAQASDIWNRSSSGDDDLLVRLFGTPDNYEVVTAPEAFTFTNTERQLNSWLKQKQRHLSDGKSYKPWVQYLLGSYGFTHAATWFYFFPLLFSVYWTWALMLMTVRCILYWGIWQSFTKQLKERSLLTYFPLFDLGWMFFNFTFLPYIVHKNKQHWK